MSESRRKSVRVVLDEPLEDLVLNRCLCAYLAVDDVVYICLKCLRRLSTNNSKNLIVPPFVIDKVDCLHDDRILIAKGKYVGFWRVNLKGRAKGCYLHREDDNIEKGSYCLVIEGEKYKKSKFVFNGEEFIMFKDNEQTICPIRKAVRVAIDGTRMQAYRYSEHDQTYILVDGVVLKDGDRVLVLDGKYIGVYGVEYGVYNNNHLRFFFLGVESDGIIRDVKYLIMEGKEYGRKCMRFNGEEFIVFAKNKENKMKEAPFAESQLPEVPRIDCPMATLPTAQVYEFREKYKKLLGFAASVVGCKEDELNMLYIINYKMHVNSEEKKEEEYKHFLARSLQILDELETVKRTSQKSCSLCRKSLDHYDNCKFELMRKELRNKIKSIDGYRLQFCFDPVECFRIVKVCVNSEDAMFVNVEVASVLTLSDSCLTYRYGKEVIDIVLPPGYSIYSKVGSNSVFLMKNGKGCIIEDVYKISIVSEKENVNIGVNR